MNVKALRDRAAELKAAIVKASKDRVAIGAAAVNEKRVMTDDERASYNALTDQLDKLKAQDAENAELLAAAEAALDAERNYRGPLLTDPDQAATNAAVASAGVQVGRDLAEADPKRGFRTSREFCQAVMQTYRTGRMDPRLKPLQATAGSDEQMGSSDPYGGFLLPTAFSPDILSIQGEADPTASLCRPVPMDAPMVKLNARVDKNHASSVSGGLVVYRHSETTEAVSSRMQFEQLSLDAHELMGLAYATESVLTDSPQAFIALISDGFRDEFAAKLLAEKLSGSGAGGQFLGVLNSPCKIEVAKETGQKAATIVKENIDAMAERCWRYGSAVWLANHNVRRQLKSLVQVVGTGGAPVPYFTTIGNQDYLDGRPLFFSEFCSTLGTAGDLILGNWSEFLVGTYQLMQQAESIHVRFVNHERAFKFWMRNAGMPWWRSALTPKNGSTLSPFVTLATRA